MDIIDAECVRCGKPTEWDDSSQEPPICLDCWDAGVGKGGLQALARQHKIAVLELHGRGYAADEIERETGLARRTVYRHLEGVTQRRANRARPFNGTVVKAAPPGRAPHGSVERNPVTHLSGRTSSRATSRHLDVPGGPPAGAPTQAGERGLVGAGRPTHPPITAMKKAAALPQRPE